MTEAVENRATGPVSEQRAAGVALRERYGIVVLLLVAGYLMTGTGASTLGRIVYAAVFLVILLTVAWSPGIPRWLRGTGVAASFVFGVLVVTTAVTQNDQAFGISLLALALLQGVAAAAIMYRIAQHDRVHSRP